MGEDATTIDLNLVPQVVEFEDFINYGGPINVVGVNTIAGAITTSVPVLLTENVIKPAGVQHAQGYHKRKPLRWANRGIGGDARGSAKDRR